MNAEDSLDSKAPKRPGCLVIFGGSFNPPHLAHVMSVAQALSWRPDAKVLVLPTYEHAFAKRLLPFEHRFAMTQAAMSIFGGRVELSALEKHLGSPSYTIRIVDYLREAQAADELALLVGTDILLELDRWHQSERLRSLVRLLVLPRPGYPSSSELCFGVEMPSLSSTELRAALARGDLEYARRRVPNAVLEYIRTHQLYSELE
ncbi:MAG: nicotinate-nicotinamide nucleotide adenylyltransferase [Myxococcota bacterium]|jgi:nicotinate-nucleotide adenylyltransferase|nr:nicotinate-nicotinamide nucleotide adenylyltransferase [Myxococcota bacterium]